MMSALTQDRKRRASVAVLLQLQRAEEEVKLNMAYDNSTRWKSKGETPILCIKTLQRPPRFGSTQDNAIVHCFSAESGERMK
jgi:hypothetical protein